MKDKENTLMDIFKSMKMYMNHFQEGSTELRTHTCDQCNNAYQNIDQLREHISNDHNKLKCEYCEFESTQSEMMTNHVLTTHTQFKCHLCTFVSNSGNSLDQHFTNEHFKPQFVCADCNSSYHTERMLKEHLRKHRQQEVKCDYCGLTLKGIPELDDHISS